MVESATKHIKRGGTKITINHTNALESQLQYQLVWHSLSTKILIRCATTKLVNKRVQAHRKLYADHCIMWLWVATWTSRIARLRALYWHRNFDFFLQVLCSQNTGGDHKVGVATNLNFKNQNLSNQKESIISCWQRKNIFPPVAPSSLIISNLSCCLQHPWSGRY
jgi:hypothetical protein